MSTLRPPGRITLGIKLGLVATFGAGLILGILSLYNYRLSRNQVFADITEDAASLGQLVLAKVENTFNTVEVSSRHFGQGRNLVFEKEDALCGIVTNFLKHNTNVLGAGVFFEPYAYTPTNYHYGIYVYRSSNGVERLQDATYKYHLMDWYVVPRELDREYWSEPYYDDGGANTMICTFSKPLHTNTPTGRPVVGMFIADVSVEWLHNMVQSASLVTNGYSFIVSGTGKFVTHPNPDYRREESIFSLAEAAGDSNLRRVGRDMIHGKSALEPITSLHTGEPSWVYYAPMHLKGWSFGVVIPESVLFADLNSMLWKQLAAIALCLAGLFATMVSIATSMTKPLRILSLKTSAMAAGDLNVELPTSRSRDEIGDLTLSFEEMRRSLKLYIDNLEKTTAAKQKIESELNIARNIQMSFIPKVFPAFPEHREFDLYATLEPAREVGGDLYNFCLTGDRYLHFCVGDVSDKGVPAALFMAVTQTLMKAVSERGNITPAEILSAVNGELCRENDALMFVTLFTSFLDLKTGELTFSNAGHNPPLIIRAGGKVEWLTLPPGLVLGVDAKAAYQSSNVKLSPGDMIVAYTDGVTEAMDHARQLYSEDRLARIATECAGRSPRETVERIMKSVKEYAGREPQSDDITVMALKIIDVSADTR